MESSLSDVIWPKVYSAQNENEIEISRHFSTTSILDDFPREIAWRATRPLIESSPIWPFVLYLTTQLVNVLPLLEQRLSSPVRMLSDPRDDCCIIRSLDGHSPRHLPLLKTWGPVQYGHLRRSVDWQAMDLSYHCFQAGGEYSTLSRDLNSRIWFVSFILSIHSLFGRANNSSSCSQCEKKSESLSWIRSSNRPFSRFKTRLAWELANRVPRLNCTAFIVAKKAWWWLFFGS